MKKIIPLLVCLFFTTVAAAQEFKGQWKGQFVDNSSAFRSFGGETCDYVLELETRGTDVSGYSYTYFSDGGKRYYTICKLKGKLNKLSHSVEVTEIERTKTNVPNHIRNCFQIHKLTYFKQGDTQTLEGSWIPAPNQEGDCGFGTTVLSRRVLKKETPLFNTATIKPAQKPATALINKDKPTHPPVIKPANPPVVVKPKTPPVVKKDNKPAVVLPTLKPGVPAKAQPIIRDSPAVKITPEIKPAPNLNFEKRSNTLLKTIEVESETFRVDLYDNGAIDGDSISLFFNGKLLLSHKRLSDKAISLTLHTDDSRDANELIMYAENLGEIPPNTALMIVTDGDHRYEVRITSDLERSGAIRFVHKPKTAQ